MIGIVVQAERRLRPAERDRPLPPDIRSWVMRLDRTAGRLPSKQHPLLGNEVLWRAYVRTQGLARLWQATRDPDDSSVRCDVALDIT